ncbi:MAG: hypothetical protein QOI80_3065 [Solirubrobacteraceae bacterium]|nr:hypothetical protein [Solirubrobacteraceae bacterium]
MSRFRAQIADAVRAVEILSPTRYSWLGEASEPLPEHVERRIGADDARGYLVYSLESRLYSDFYCHGRAVAPAPPEPVDAVRGDAMLVEALSHSNAGRGCWEPGWLLRRRDGDELVVERGGLTLRATPDECRGLPSPDAVDVEIEVRYPKELLRASPGFYMALAERPFDDSEGLVRLYWNLAPEGAVAFVSEATRLVGEAGFGARLKVANDPRLYDRCDAGVIYLPRAEALRGGELVRSLHAAVAPMLRAPVPAFTKRVAAGVGLAEDPGGGQSFGQARCHVVAEALVGAYERGIGDHAGRVAAVRDRMLEEGLDPDAPYLRPGASDDYEPLRIDERPGTLAG